LRIEPFDGLQHGGLAGFILSDEAGNIRDLEFGAVVNAPKVSYLNTIQSHELLSSPS
jgi:hypothetical protein